MTYRVLFSNGYSTIFVDVVNTRKMYRMISKMCKRMATYDLHRFAADLYFFKPARVDCIYKVNKEGCGFNMTYRIKTNRKWFNEVG